MFAAAVRAFFRDIPETALLFDVEQMIKDGRAKEVPSYCRAQPVTRHREELPIDRA
jgi:hypothetical protein